MQTSLLKWDRFIAAHLPWFVLACVALGVSLPNVFSPLSSIMAPLLAFMTFANSLGGGFRELGNALLHPLPVLITLTLLHLVLPLIALGLGTLLFPNAPLFTTGLVLEYVSPTAVSSLMWVGMCGGNSMLCLSIVLLDTLISPVVIPLVLRLLVGSVVEVDALSMVMDMLVMVAIPAILSMTLFQLTHGKVATTLKPRLAFFSKLSLLTMVVTNATGCVPFLKNIDRTLVLVMISVVAVCVIGFLLGYWVSRLLKLPYSVCSVTSLNSGLRNINIGTILAIEYFPPAVRFPVAFTPVFLQFFTSIVMKVLSSVPFAKAHAASRNQTTV